MWIKGSSGNKYLYLLLYLLAILAIVRFTIVPMMAEKKRLSREIDKLDKRVSSLIKLQKSVDKMDMENRRIEALIKKYQKLFFERGTSDLLVSTELIDSIFQEAKKNNLEFKSCEVGKPVKKPGFSVFPIEVKVKGDFIQLRDFLMDLRKKGKLIRVSQVKIQPGKEDNLSITLLLEGMRIE